MPQSGQLDMAVVGKQLCKHPFFFFILIFRHPQHSELVIIYVRAFFSNSLLGRFVHQGAVQGLPLVQTLLRFSTCQSHFKMYSQSSQTLHCQKKIRDLRKIRTNLGSNSITKYGLTNIFVLSYPDSELCSQQSTKILQTCQNILQPRKSSSSG